MVENNDINNRALNDPNENYQDNKIDLDSNDFNSCSHNFEISQVYNDKKQQKSSDKNKNNKADVFGKLGLHESVNIDKLDENNENETNFQANQIYTTVDFNNINNNLHKSIEEKEDKQNLNFSNTQQLPSYSDKNKEIPEHSQSLILGNYSNNETGYFIINYNDPADKSIGYQQLYSLCYKDKQKANKIYCKERSYSHFDNLRLCFRHFFPSVILPKLPNKDYNMNKFISDTNFLNDRFKKLNHFFKAISRIAEESNQGKEKQTKSDIIKYEKALVSPIYQLFNDFLKEQNLNSNYFNSNLRNNMKDIFNTELDLENGALNPIFYKESDYIINNFSNKFTSLLSKQQIKRKVTENEINIRNLNKDIFDLSKNYKDFFSFVQNIITECRHESELYLKISKNLTYLKGYSLNDRDVIRKGIDDLDEKYQNFRLNANKLFKQKNEVESLLDEIEYNILDIEGAKELISHYDELLKYYEVVISANMNTKDHKNLIEKEKVNFEKLKMNYEEKAIQSLEEFLREFREKYPETLNKVNRFYRNFLDAIII